MRSTLAASLICGMILWPGRPKAASLTTAELYAMCGKPDDASQAACRFYILGTAEGAEISWLSGQRKPLFCVPDGVTSLAMERAFVTSVAQRALDHPELAGVSAVASVLFAFEHQFDCAVADARRP